MEFKELCIKIEVVNVPFPSLPLENTINLKSANSINSKMKKTIILLSILSYTLSFSQTNRSIVDGESYSSKNYKLFEGGSEKVKIDSTTNVNELILRLEDKWEFEFTGKGYLIGYTNLMFSIANHGEKTLDSLIKLYTQTKTKDGKWGALYTIYLIGIESKSAYSFKEDFKSTKARKALLFLLENETTAKYQKEIVKLLLRNPWEIDLEILFKKIEENKFESWFLINALFRYGLESIPFNQEIPEPIASEKYLYEKPASYYVKNDPFLSSFYKDYLKHLTTKFPNIIVIEESVFDNNLYGYPGSTNCGMEFYNSFILKSMVNLTHVISYANIAIDNEVQYYVEDEVIFVIDYESAKLRWLSWYRK